MIGSFLCFVSVERRRRLQVVTVNSITTVENGRLGNLKLKETILCS